MTLLNDQRRKLADVAGDDLDDGQVGLRVDAVSGLPFGGCQLHLSAEAPVPCFDDVAREHSVGGYR